MSAKDTIWGKRCAIFLLLGLSLALSGCSYFAEQQGTKTAAAASATAAIWTPTSTATRIPTRTRTPTSAPTRTMTPVPTRTPTPTITPTPTMTQVPVQAIILKFEESFELVTMTVEEVVPRQTFTQINGHCGLFQLNPTQIEFSGEGTVRAGVDLALITRGDIQVSGQSVVVTFPEPKIIALSTSHTILNVQKPFDYFVCGSQVSLQPSSSNTIDRLVKDAVLTAACEGNILDKANAVAKEVVYDLLRQLGFTTITINSQPSGNCP